MAAGRAPTRAELRALVPEQDPSVLVGLTVLARLARVSDAALQRLTRPHGLTPAEVAVLMTLWWAGPPHRATPTELRAGLAQTSGGVTATLGRLERAGLVERLRDPADGRRLLVALTARGRRAARDVLDDLATYWSRVFDDVPDRAATLGALRGVLDALERAEGLTSTSELGA